MSQRVVAWGQELREIHRRLRDALGVARSAVEDGGSGPTAARDLQLYCVGFCAALTGDRGRRTYRDRWRDQLNRNVARKLDRLGG